MSKLFEVKTKTATKMQKDPELAKEQALRVNAKKSLEDPELADNSQDL